MLEAALRERFGREVVIADPFRRFEVRDKGVSSIAADAAPDYTAAVGLALRAMGDEYPGFNLLLAADRPEYKKSAYAGLGTVVPVVGISALLFGIVMVHLAQESKLAGLHARLQEVRKESALYRDKIALVEELSRKRADVATRIDVISGLDRNRFARVRLLQLATDNLPALTWVTNVQESKTPRGPGFNLSGVTSSNLKVSEFMTNLLQSDGVQAVDLLVSEQTEIAEIEVTKFTLQVVMPELGVAEPAPAQPVNLIKKGAQALREKREVEDQLKKEASK
jgi:Tfp pilus assembly protein PilN